MTADEQAAAHAEGWNHYLDRLLAETSSAAAGPDDWAAAPDPIDHFNAADASLAVLLRVLRNITSGDYGKPTPCQNFDIGQLLDHLAGSLKSVDTALGADLTDHTDASAEVRIAGLAQPTLEAFTHRGAEGTIDMGFAQLPATVVAGIVNLELLVHAWDFAMANGQEIRVSDVVSA